MKAMGDALDKVQKQQMQMQQNQRGVALIMVMMIAAFVTVIVAVLAERQMVQMRLKDNISAIEQAYQHAYGLETMAIRTLERDFIADQERGQSLDTMQEAWAKKQDDIEVESGKLAWQLIDLQGRVNINNVRPLTEAQAQPYVDAVNASFKPSGNNASTAPSGNVNNNSNGSAQATNKSQPTPITTKYFIEKYNDLMQNRLRDALVLSSKKNISMSFGELEADRIAKEIQDWVDLDTESYEFGGEDGIYSRFDIPYYSANQWLASATEMKMMDGLYESVSDTRMAEKLIDDSATMLTALPDNTVPININTASKEVLMAMSLSEADAEAVLASPDSGIEYTDLNAFIEQVPNFTGLDAKEKGVLKQSLTLNSRYFLLLGAVDYRQAKLNLYSVLHRNDDGSVRVMHRSFNAKEVYHKDPQEESSN